MPLWTLVFFITGDSISTVLPVCRPWRVVKEIHRSTGVFAITTFAIARCTRIHLSKAVANGQTDVRSKPLHQCFCFTTKCRFGHPVNYVFSSSKKIFSGWKYPKTSIIKFWKQKHCLAHVSIEGEFAGSGSWACFMQWFRFQNGIYIVAVHDTFWFPNVCVRFLNDMYIPE